MTDEKRVFPRIPRRVSCDVVFSGSRHVGVVMNLSAGGFFIQTGAAPTVGSTVQVTLRTRERGSVDVQAKVTNRRRVPPRLATVSRGGLGCRLSMAPEDYYQLLADLGGL